MSFASPLMLVGVAAAAVPLLIHLAGRRRAPRVRFAAIDFVLRSNRRVARRLLLRQWLLLATRMLLVALVAVAMAKPFMETPSTLPAVGEGPQSAVLIIDDTLSMRRRVDDGALFVRARSQARTLAGMLRGRAELAVLSLSQPSGPLAELTQDSRRVLSAISRVSAGEAHHTLAPALAVATRLLGVSRMPRRQIYLLGDAAAHGLGAKLSEQLPKGVGFRLIDVTQELGQAVLDNAAITKLSAVPSSSPGLRTMRIDARICNYSAKAYKRRVTLHLDGAPAARGMMQLEPWRCGTKSFQHSFAKAGMHNAVVSQEADALAEDDARYMRVEVGSAIKVLLVNGAPSPVRHKDELFYLETALSTPGPGGQPINTEVRTVAELKQLQLAGYDAVVLCNVAAVPRPWGEELTRFVRGGGGLLITLGDQVDAARTNASLGGLLPAALRGASSATPVRTGEPELRLGRVDVTHPVVAPLWSKEGGGLRNARFTRTFRVRPDSRADRRSILWYEDGSPALLERRLGEGRVLLFTSTADRDWTDMPIRPGYLPLMQQIVRYLGRVPMHAPRRSMLVGQRAVLQVPPRIRQLRLSGPEGLEQVWSQRQMAGRSSLEVAVPTAGFYGLSAVGLDGVVQKLERGSFMANVDAAESDFRRGSASSLRVGGRANRAKVALRRVELWHLLGAVLLMLLMLESFIGRRG